MEKDFYLIYFESAQEPRLNAALHAAGLPLKIADGKISPDVAGALIEKNPGNLIFVCPFSGEPYLPKAVAEALNSEMDALYLKAGLPKNGEVLIGGSSVYGCLLKNGENSVLLLDSGHLSEALAPNSIKTITESLCAPVLSDSSLELLRRLKATAAENTDIAPTNSADENIYGAPTDSAEENTQSTEDDTAVYKADVPENADEAEAYKTETFKSEADKIETFKSEADKIEINKSDVSKSAAAIENSAAAELGESTAENALAEKTPANKKIPAAEINAPNASAVKTDALKSETGAKTMQDFIAPPTPGKSAVGNFSTVNYSKANDFLAPPIPKNEGTPAEAAQGGERSYAEENGIKPRRVIDPELLKGFSEDNVDVLQEKPKKSPFKIVAGILAVVLAVTATVGGITFYKNRDGARCDKVYKELAAKVSKGDSADGDCDLKNKYAALTKTNADFVGFFTPSGAKYGYPVVTAEEKGAAYYETHLFGGEKNRYGTIYTETAASLADTAPILVLKNSAPDSGRLLGLLAPYLKQSYYEKHKTFLFDTLNTPGEWAVFAAFSYEKTEPFMIERTSFLNDSLFNSYISNLKEHSKIKCAVAVEPQDRLLITVRKNGDSYTVVAARKLRENETADKISDTVTAAVDAVSSAAQSAESKSGSSQTKTTSFDSVISAIGGTKKPTAVPTGRYEQTGLTTDMDKTAKVQMDRVVTMVNVTGMNKSGAKSILQSTLGVNVSIEEKESTEPRGTVLEQSVADGAEISTDVTVTLTVSIGLSSGKTVVPELVGNLEANAEAILDRSNLRKGKVTKQKSALEKGTILSQSIDEGKKTNINTKIDLIVSDGTGKITTVKMPNLSGKSKSKASAALKKAGLKVGKISTVTSSKKAGTVIKQECPAGKKVQQGEAVGFSVSNGSKVNNLTVTNGSSWSVKVNGKYYSPGAVIKGDYNDIIPCIVEAEMGSGCHIEGLKAQAVAAYCWLINAGSTKGSAPSVPMKTPESKAKKAAAAVAGQRVMYGGEVAQTYYYAISAGYSANCKDIWFADLPYLRAVASPGDKKASGYKTTETYSAATLKSRVKSVYGVDLSGISKTKWFSVKYDENGAYVRSVSLGGKKTVRGVSFRDELLNYELRSSAFKVSYNKSRDRFTFTVYGYGHGVGMSQVGADYYAGLGWSYEQILTHYYKGTTVK